MAGVAPISASFRDALRRRTLCVRADGAGQESIIKSITPAGRMDSGLVYAKMRSRPGMTAFISGASSQAIIAPGFPGSTNGLKMNLFPSWPGLAVRNGVLSNIDVLAITRLLQRLRVCWLLFESDSEERALARVSKDGWLSYDIDCQRSSVRPCGR